MSHQTLAANFIICSTKESLDVHVQIAFDWFTILHKISRYFKVWLKPLQLSIFQQKMIFRLKLVICNPSSKAQTFVAKETE